MVNTDDFSEPFGYRLKVHRDGGSPQAEAVDLQETFHYLIGLKVRRMNTYERAGRTYRVSRGEVARRTGSDEVVVILRPHETEADGSLYDSPEEGEPDPLIEEQKWLEEEVLTGDEDIVYINGGAPFKKARALEVTFREKMEA